MKNKDDLINQTLIFSNPIKNLVKSYSRELKIKFSFPLTILYILDQIGLDILPAFFAEDEYQAAWLKKFGLDVCKNELEEYLAKYRIIRKKYARFPVCLDSNVLSENGLFCHNPLEVNDPIFDVFSENDTVERAIEGLKSLLTVDEMSIFSGILGYFKGKIETLIEFNIKEMNEFSSEINALLESNGTSQYIERIRDFYESEYQSLKSVNIIWSPGSCGGVCLGDHILIRMPSINSIIDISHTHNMMSSIVVHEIAHHISGNMASEKKNALTKAFMQHCDIAEYPHFRYALEEPLAMAAQMLYLKQTYSKPSWFNDPVSKLFLEVLEAHLLQGKYLDLEFIEKCSKASLNKLRIQQELDSQKLVLFNMAVNRLNLSL